jgi:uncharacterized protein YyaL (SSP411 family)
LITLYEATFEPRYYGEAIRLADEMIERFADAQHGGFFTTASDQQPLVTRRKDLEDSPIPSGNSAAALSLLRLALLSGEDKYERHALGVLRLLFPPATRYPSAFGHLLQAADFYLAPVREVAIVGQRGAPDTEALLRVVFEPFLPNKVVAGGAAPIPLLEARDLRDGHATAYVCEHYVCQAPTTDPDQLRQLLVGES